MSRFHHKQESDIPVVPTPIKEVFVNDGEFTLVAVPDSKPSGDFRDYSITNLQKAGIPLERMNASIEGNSFDNIDSALNQLKNSNLNNNESEN